MINCQSCGRENYAGAQFCDRCGIRLAAAEEFSPAAADEFSPAPEPVMPLPEMPVFQPVSVTSVGIPPVVEESKEDLTVAAAKPTALEKKHFHASLTIERGNNIGKAFNLSAADSYIGRWDADNGVFPDVDLDAHDPEAKVSRRHARILWRDGQYAVEDLGSTNGTYINRGRRLIPGSPQTLNDGDEIIAGKTFLRFKITN